MASFLDIALPVAGAIGSLIGGRSAGRAAERAADVQAGASQAAIDEQRRQFDLIRADLATVRGDLAPFREQGVNALNQFAGSVLGPLEATPAFKFQLEQGVNALERGASARGKLFSGQQAKALTEFGQGLGSLEANNHLNRLAALAGIGQSAVNTGGTLAGLGGQFGSSAASNIGNFLTDQGAARASGFVGKANALTDSINNALLFGALLPRRA